MSPQSRSKITPAPAAASLQLTAGIIPTATVTQLPVFTAHGTSGVSFKHLRDHKSVHKSEGYFKGARKKSYQKVKDNLNVGDINTNVLVLRMHPRI